MAQAARGRFAAARADHDALVKLAAGTSPDLKAGQSQAKDVFDVAAKVLEARIATLQNKKNSLALWAEATALGDKLAYSEPDDWFYPVRHYEGAALLKAGRAKEAEAVYREDLRRHPHNGWALFGLWKSLAAEKKIDEAGVAKLEFEQAWKNADIKLASTAF